jgi:predicted enzyme related to lactoylglutathione lyase
MVDRTSYTDGEPCWADVMARDAEVSRRFYAKVFGWTFDISGPEYGAYAMCLSAGRPVAGMMPWNPNLGEEPTAWSLYFATAEIERTVAAVTRLGGQVTVAPMDIPSSGRMAFCSDPTGVPFGLWQPAEHRGFGQVGQQGSFAWAELVTRAPLGEDTFYKELFGYVQRQTGLGDADYEIWSLGEREICGRMKMPPEMAENPDIQDQWSLYFAVDDADRAADRVLQAGGTVARTPHDSPYGRMARVTDPEGALFHIIDLARRHA